MRLIVFLLLLALSTSCSGPPGHMHWDEMNEQDLICDATQERLGGVATWDVGKTWTVYDKGSPRRTYVDKHVAMRHAESSLGGDCPSN